MTDDSPVYVPLVCPLSGTKIRNPVRAPGSNTYACFDKESFALSGRYTCPLTGVYCLVTELQRDEAMAAILAATPDDATFALVNAQVLTCCSTLPSPSHSPRPGREYRSATLPRARSPLPPYSPSLFPSPSLPAPGRLPRFLATRTLGPSRPGVECSPREGP
jgi:hypothetical protein